MVIIIELTELETAARDDLYSLTVRTYFHRCSLRIIRKNYTGPHADEFRTLEKELQATCNESFESLRNSGRPHLPHFSQLSHGTGLPKHIDEYVANAERKKRVAVNLNEGPSKRHKV